MHTINFKQTFRNEEFLDNVFIPSKTNWQSTEEQQLSVKESGPKQVLFHNIIEHIEQAEEMICLQSFLIQDTSIIDALVKASQRDVKVFILDAAETRLKTQAYPEDDSFIFDEYKEMINNKFRRNFVHRQAENLHAKFILIDPKSYNANGFLFTGNFNEKPFKENPELGIALDESQTNDLFKLFVYHFWEHTTDEQNDTQTFDKVRPANKFQAPKLDHILCTSPNPDLSNLKSTLHNAIKNAEDQISFSTFGLDIEHELAQGILNKIKSGIEVTIFCRPREKTIVNHISELQKAGAMVFCHPLIHAKSIILDGKEAYVFTANFEKHGMDTGFEVGISLSNKQTKDLIGIYNKWKQDFPLTFHSQKSVQEISNYNAFKNNALITDEISETKKILQKKEITKLMDLTTFLKDTNGTNNFEKHKNLEISKVATLKAFTENESAKLEPVDEVLSKVLIKATSSSKKKKGENRPQEAEIKWRATDKIVVNVNWVKSNKKELLQNINSKWSEYKNMELYGN
ncbi:Phosphatidylserine/phosphatidylglycerophosphate/cardiolipin synthase [Nonlabens sp. Hel1_33_55]|uniref:phospholipase D-like domain-containing protein n=1 Tax=Nonlabens sp. Hel1_33_55 TaxID=1336802 RepID=UPI000875DB86|nr:phosphatidylserine/phosphatidylglycerophosphate/cardiolipin synthase family protein [Nonlabens sp. Hel1_33_55]SCY41156.1 Phosphatidylserine/phosphatidylglycerophosphate/cardiolipin synthase [Nonlabens sp. Hel1_33_55]